MPDIWHFAILKQKRRLNEVAEVKLQEAAELIQPAIPQAGGRWADLGAGKGTFTRALARLLGPQARIIAVDRDARALGALRARAEARDGSEAAILPVQGDFRDPASIRELHASELDGVLLANSLHYVAEAELVLQRIATLLRPGARIVVVEYEGRRPSPWVPYPVSVARLHTLAVHAGLQTPVVVAERPSAYGGVMYCAACTRVP